MHENKKYQIYIDSVSSSMAANNYYHILIMTKLLSRNVLLFLIGLTVFLAMAKCVIICGHSVRAFSLLISYARHANYDFILEVSILYAYLRKMSLW